MSDLPSKPFTSLTIGWGGFVNIPVGVYSGEDEGEAVIKRQEFSTKGNAVGRQSIDKVTGDVLTNMAIVKKAQATDGRWVELDNAEIASVIQPEARCTIEAYVPLASIGQRYRTDSWYQVRPKRDKGKVDANVEQGFALFMDALAERGVAAFAKIVLRSPAFRYAVILPDGRMATLLWDDGERPALPMPSTEGLTDKHRAAAAIIMDELADVPEPVVVNTATAAVQAYVDAKAAGLPTPPPDAPQAREHGDLMADLMASVEAAKAKTPAKRNRKKAA